MGRNDIYDTPPMRAALGLYAFRQGVHAELIAAEEAAHPEHICKLLTSVRDEEDSNDADRILQRTVFHNAEP